MIGIPYRVPSDVQTNRRARPVSIVRTGALLHVFVGSRYCTTMHEDTPEFNPRVALAEVAARVIPYLR